MLLLSAGYVGYLHTLNAVVTLTGIIHLAKLNVTTVFHVHQIAGQIQAIAILHTPGQTSKCYHCPPGVTHTWPNWMLLPLHRCNTYLAKLNITAVEQVQHAPGQTDCYCCHTGTTRTWPNCYRCHTGATHTWPNWLLLLSHRCNTHLAKLTVIAVIQVQHTPGQIECYCRWTGATHTWPNWVLLSYGPTGASGIGPDCKCVHADLLSHTATGKSFGPCFTGL